MSIEFIVQTAGTARAAPHRVFESGRFFMPQDDINELAKTVLALDGEVRHLRRLVYLQKAHIDALRIYCVAKIADLNRAERKAEFAHMTKMVQTLYDRFILEVESKHPALASDIDVRSELSEPEQEDWYLASEYFPKKDEPSDGDKPD